MRTTVKFINSDRISIMYTYIILYFRVIRSSFNDDNARSSVTLTVIIHTVRIVSCIIVIIIALFSFLFARISTAYFIVMIFIACTKSRASIIYMYVCYYRAPGNSILAYISLFILYRCDTDKVCSIRCAFDWMRLV